MHDQRLCRVGKSKGGIDTTQLHMVIVLEASAMSCKAPVGGGLVDSSSGMAGVMQAIRVKVKGGICGSIWWVVKPRLRLPPFLSSTMHRGLIYVELMPSIIAALEAESML